MLIKLESPELPTESFQERERLGGPFGVETTAMPKR